MEDDLDAAEDERTIELSSIAAIYPEIVIDPSDPYKATLNLEVTPEEPLKIVFQASPSAPPTLPTPPTSTETDDDNAGPEISIKPAAVDTHELSHLAPLRIKITLPPEYPTNESPVVDLSTSPGWIPTKILASLKDDCRRLWEEIGKDQVVYTYIDHLQQAAERAFDVSQEEVGGFKLSGDLKLALLDFDLKTKREQFERETFDCGICLEPKKGLQCHRLLLCGHVFCIGCLQDFYNNCIMEGDVDSVKCLAPSCGKNDPNSTPGKRRKHDRTLNPSELLQIPLEQETVQRYVRLKRKKKLEADKNTIYCPRQWCQGAAKSNKHPKPSDPFDDGSLSSDSEPEPVQPSKKIKKLDSEDIPMADRLCICEDCNFAFCSVCKKGWHGDFARCNPRRQAELNEEEKASLEYMQRFSTACPTCNAPSQKTHGCNHMICFKCKTHFCYLCSSYLMPDNPYRHFNDFKSPCYMRLWELEQGDGADAGNGFAGGEGGAPAWNPEDFDTDSNSDSNSSEEDEDGPGRPPIFIGHADNDNDPSSSDDDEPAPDQRRPNRNANMHIEIVNFAGDGANRRIELPQRPRDAPPPRAPDPPAQRRRRRRNHPQRQQQQGPPHQAQRPNVAPPLPAPPAAAAVDAPRNLPAAAPGQGNNNVALPAGVRAMGGLERFLELAQQDLEEEWDSDELDEDVGIDDLPVPLPPVAGRNQNRRHGAR